MKKTLIALSLLGTSLQSYAGIISQTDFDSGRTLGSGTYGQSFIAEDSSISLAFGLMNANPNRGYGELVRYSIIEGDGLGGTELLSLIGTPSGGGYFEMDFSALTLNVGEIYTATVEAVADSWRWGIRINRGVFTGDQYTDGRAYNHANNFTNITDLAFTISPAAAATPPATQVSEPSTLAVLAASLFGFAAYKRKRVK